MPTRGDDIWSQSDRRAEYEGFSSALLTVLGARAVALAQIEDDLGRPICIYRSGACPSSWIIGRPVPESPGGIAGAETRVQVGGGGSKGLLIALWASGAQSPDAETCDRIRDLARPLARAHLLADQATQHAQDHTLLGAILSTLVDSVVTIAEDGTILSVNDATLTLFGYSRDQLIGANVSVLMPDDDAQKHDGYLARYRRTGRARIIGFGREVDARRADGSIFPIQLAISEVRGSSGRLFTGILSDISKRRQAEAELKDTLAELRGFQAQLVHAEKMSALGRMLAGFAHELNNPIMSISTFAQYCARRTPPDDRRHAVLRDIEYEAERCARIVRGLLDFSRTGTTAESPRRAEDLRAILTRVCDLFAPQMTRQDVAIEVYAAEDIPLVMGSPDQIEQVLVNLISNSLDALREVEHRKGEIRAELRVVESHVRLVLSDNGAGIDPAVLSKIFDPFFTTKPVGSGTGLGLSISQGIVRSHGGSLRCMSTPGTGTRFELDLPIAHPTNPGVEP